MRAPVLTGHVGGCQIILSPHGSRCCFVIVLWTWLASRALHFTSVLFVFPACAAWPTSLPGMVQMSQYNITCKRFEHYVTQVSIVTARSSHQIVTLEQAHLRVDNILRGYNWAWIPLRMDAVARGYQCAWIPLRVIPLRMDTIAHGYYCVWMPLRMDAIASDTIGDGYHHPLMLLRVDTFAHGCHWAWISLRVDTIGHRSHGTWTPWIPLRVDTVAC